MPHREPTTRIVRQLRGGQITIPAEFRRQLGIEEEALLHVTLSHGEMTVKPVRLAEQKKRDPDWLKELYAEFALVRQEAARYREDEINADIDRALAEVRQQNG